MCDYVWCLSDIKYFHSIKDAFKWVWFKWWIWNLSIAHASWKREKIKHQMRLIWNSRSLKHALNAFLLSDPALSSPTLCRRPYYFCLSICQCCFECDSLPLKALDYVLKRNCSLCVLTLWRWILWTAVWGLTRRERWQRWAEGVWVSGGGEMEFGSIYCRQLTRRDAQLYETF